MDIGQGLAMMGQSIAGGMQQYHQEHQQYDAQLALARMLSQMAVNEKGNIVQIDPNVKDKTLQPIIAPKALEQFNTGAKINRAEAMGKLKVLTDIGMITARHGMENTPPEFYEGPGGTTIYKWGNRGGAIQPGGGRTTNPDLNFTHAVNAHEKQMDAIEKNMTENFGVHPLDVLNSKNQKGYAWDEQSKTWKDAPDYDSAQGVLLFGPKIGNQFLSKDTLEELKPQAEAWKKMQQNAPSRSDYQQPQAGAVRSGVASAQAAKIKALYKSGKISRSDAVKQIQALNTGLR